MNNNQEGEGWVLKLPYVTNQRPKYFKNPSHLWRGLRIYEREYSDIIPYAMLQPCMANKRECKMVFLNGQFAHFAKSSNIGKAFISTDIQREEIKRFAEMIVTRVRQQIPHSITDGLLRIDIFRNCRGAYVVNEIESLEGRYWSRGGNRALVEEQTVDRFLLEYWTDVLRKCVAALRG